MKTKKIFILAIVLLGIALSVSAQVAVNSSGNSPDPSAMLDVSSTTKGMLIPRMTFAEREAISNPATGLMIYQTDNTPGFYYNAGTPTVKAWTFVSAGTSAGWSLTGNSAIDSATNFIGTTDNKPLIFRINNVPHLRLSPGG